MIFYTFKKLNRFFIIIILTSVNISTTFFAKFSILAEGSAEISKRTCVIGNGKLTKTALSRLAAR